MNSKSTIRRIVFLALLAIHASPSAAWAHVPIPPKSPASIGRREVNISVPDFSLKDQDDKAFRFANVRGQVILITFIFTTCPDVCPLLTANFAAIQRALEKEKIKNYVLLSITTDPEQDTPAILKEYAGRFKADFRRWSFLTGGRAEVAKVWKMFGVNVIKNESGQVQHTTFTTLVDRRGNRRVDYYGDRWSDTEVLRDIHWLRGNGLSDNR
jgi:protein SCO1/2